MPAFIRPSSAKTKYNIGSMLRTASDQCEYIRIDTPAAAAALPTISAVVQEYVAVQKDAPTVVCSGTVEAVNDVYGIAVEDQIAASTSSLYITRAKAVLMAIDAVTPAVGEDAYIIPASKLVTNVSTSNHYIGKFNKVKETNPTGLPAGDYAEVNFRQEQI